jgi:hypothetical protein
VTAIAVRARSWLATANRGLLAVRDDLTPGQRWTASLCMVLVLLVLRFGLPQGLVTGDLSGAGVTGARPSAVSSPNSPSAPGGAPAGAQLGGLYQAPPLGAPPGGGLGDQAAPFGPTGAAAVEAPPSFVALVRAGDNTVPGRDDASVAKAFLAHGGFPVVTLSIPAADPAFCSKVTAAGNVVLAGGGLDPVLRDCLVRAGETVVAYDGLGDKPPAGGGQVLSTRRGLLDSLVDLGRWGASGSAGALRGRVGLVIDDTARDTAGAVATAYKSLGVNLAATAVVTSDATDSSVTDGVRSFAAKGVEVAVLATPVAVQNRWVAQAGALIPGLRYVVSDAFDAVANETYPATFDGALTYTSLRVPWFARAHGQTPDGTACLQAWQSTVTPAATLSNDETIDVLAWCEEVHLVVAALAAPGSFSQAARALPLASPLTSDLGPLPAGGWGPRQNAVLAWSSSCACWQEKAPFSERNIS